MRKFLLLPLLLLVTQFKVYSQINPITEEDKAITKVEIGELKIVGSFQASCTLFIDKKTNDSTYVISFLNGKYSTLVDIVSFSFDETGGDFEKLFKLIETNLAEKAKKEIEIPLKNGTLTLVFDKYMGTASMSMRWYSKGVLSYSGYFTLKQYKKLFGKTDK